ncbi:MAG TPA: hypothetical protein VKM94_06860 [Blastocatellia bacterium]|nr:hypothetical protein [Blastocatellia bacterium]
MRVRFSSFVATICCLALGVPAAPREQKLQTCIELQRRGGQTRTAARMSPVLGADLSFASNPSPLIEGWQDKQKGDVMAAALKAAGVDSLRFLFGGLYSPRGPEATAEVKRENKLDIGYAWFPVDDYVEFIATHDFTTVVGVNVEEGPVVASSVIKRFLDRGLRDKLVAVELSNEPWLNPRPWLPEDYAARAADIIEGLTPLGVPFALPLTVGSEKKTPTRLSDNEWNERMLKTISERVKLGSRSDIYGVLHLYSRGVSSEAIDAFNKQVSRSAPGMRYLITEFNIRSSLQGNPHLTNKYALEFGRKVADVMRRREVVGLYTHSVPSHSIVYWANGRRFATVVGGRDDKLSGDAMSRGWHTTPTGRVYGLYSRLAWRGELLMYKAGGEQSYWAVRTPEGRQIVTLLNAGGSSVKKRIDIAGKKVELRAPSHSIVCFDSNGSELEKLILE